MLVAGSHALRWIGFAFGLGLLVAVACEDDRLAGLHPRGITSDLEPVVPDSGGFIGSYTLPTPPNNNVAYADANTGIALPPGLIVRVAVHGMLTFVQNPDYINCINQGHLNPATLPGGVTSIGPGGDQGTYAVTVGKWYGSSTASGNLMKPADVNSDSAFANMGVTASGYTVFAGRPAVYLISCSINGQGNYPGYSPVNGAQVVTVTALPPPKITVNRTTVVNGDTVTATLSVSWTTNVDVYYAYWQWVADTGANGGGASFVSGSGCGSSTTCKVIPHGDGHLQVPNVNLDGTGLYQTAVSPTIHVAQAHLTLTVDSSHVASGSQVKFTAHRGDAKPVVVQSWVWTPGSTSPLGPLAVDCAGGDSICVTTVQNTSPADTTGVPQTGTMMAVSYVGTAAESASVSVTVDHPIPSGPPCTAPAGTTRIMASSAKSGAQTSSRSPGARGVMLTCGGGGGGTPSLTLTPRTANLYPRVRELWVNGIHVLERVPDTAFLQVTLMQGTSPAPLGTPVSLRAEFLPNSGGHAHLGSTLPFTSAAKVDSGPVKGTPVVGYFLSGSGQSVPDVHLTTDASGTAATKLVAGYVGGQARLIASAYVGDRVLNDTTVVTFVVPGLVALSDGFPSTIYWIGGTPNVHPQYSNFYVQAELVQSLQAIAESLKQTTPLALYLQYNDASLPNGGAFTVDPTQAPGGQDSPFRDHKAHAVGMDIDVGLCYADAYGDGDDKQHRLSGSYQSGTISCRDYLTNLPIAGRAVSQDRLNNMAQLFNGVNGVHPNLTSGTHYHIRFQ